MSFNRPLVAAALAAASATFVMAEAYSATYTPGDLPPTTEQGQSGTNVCGTTDSQTSECQTMYFNSIDDWCIWGPPEPNGVIGVTERIEVAWCLASGHGARLIPNGAIQGLHMRVTPNWAEITGHGDLTQLNIKPGDAGGELDPHGMDGNGNPIGGIVFSDIFTPGSEQQIFEWMNFVSATEFCFRICNPADPNAWLYCQHVYDEMGCQWVMPGDYGNGFDECDADASSPPGIANWGQPDASTFSQGGPVTPPAAAPPSSSNCQSFPNLAYGQPAASIGSSNGTSSVSSATTAVTTTTGAPSPTTTTSSSEIPSATNSGSPQANNNGSGAGSLAVPLAAVFGLFGLSFAL